MDGLERKPAAPDNHAVSGVARADVEAMCRRAFGDDVAVDAVTKIGVGTYNSTYRIEIARRDPVILRVAPDDGQDAMRNEHAAAPFLAALGALVPRVLAVDFTRQVAGRDYMIQALLPGVPASSIADLPASYYRQLGAITRTIHEIRGDRFGRVAGPTFATWSDALTDAFAVLARGYDDAGLDSTPVRRIDAAVGTHRDAVDAVVEPRLLHGDLWQLNVLVAGPDDVTVTGVLDWDAASWGDPLADWTIHQVRLRAGKSDVDAFWEMYGPPPDDADAGVRQLLYEARSRAGSRLDIHRRGLDTASINPVHWDVADIADALALRR